MNQPTAITVALLDENSLTVHFKFDELVVLAMRTVQGAVWAPKLHAWVVPRSQADVLEAALSPWVPYVIWHLAEPVNPHHLYVMFSRWASGAGPLPDLGQPWAELLFRAVGPGRADAVFKSLARVLHPDAPGGDAELMKALVAARPVATKNEKGQVA